MVNGLGLSSNNWMIRERFYLHTTNQWWLKGSSHQWILKWHGEDSEERGEEKNLVVLVLGEN